MAGHLANHGCVEVAAATIAAGNATTWTKVATALPDILALMLLNDLDAGGVELRFEKVGNSAPNGTTAPAHVILAAGEPFFVNYKNIAMFAACEVYFRSRAVEPAAGSLRFNYITRMPLGFHG